MGTEREPGPSCVLNGCKEPQGLGTWVSVFIPLDRLSSFQRADRPSGYAEVVTLPVCEDHWKALRKVGR